MSCEYRTTQGEIQDSLLDSLYTSSSPVKEAQKHLEILINCGILQSDLSTGQIDFDTYNWSTLAESIARIAILTGSKDYGDNPRAGLTLFESAFEILDKAEKDQLEEKYIEKYDEKWEGRLDYLKVKTCNDFGIMAGEIGGSNSRNLFIKKFEQILETKRVLLEQRESTSFENAQEKWFGELLHTAAYVYVKSGKYQKAYQSAETCTQWYQKQEDVEIKQKPLRKANATRRKLLIEFLLGKTSQDSLDQEKESRKWLKKYYGQDPLNNGPIYREHFIEETLLRAFLEEYSIQNLSGVQNIDSEALQRIFENISRNLVFEGYSLTQQEHGFIKVSHPVFKKEEFSDISYQLTSIAQIRELLKIAELTDKELEADKLKKIVFSIVFEDYHTANRFSRNLLIKPLNKLIEQLTLPEGLETIDFRLFFNHRIFDCRKADLEHVVNNLSQMTARMEEQPSSLRTQALLTKFFKTIKPFASIESPHQVWQRLMEDWFRGKPEGLFLFETPCPEELGLENLKQEVQRYNNYRKKRLSQLREILSASATPDEQISLVERSLRELPGLKTFVFATPLEKGRFQSPSCTEEKSFQQAREQSDFFHVVKKDNRLFFLIPHEQADGRLALEWIENFYETFDTTIPSDIDNEQKEIIFGEEKFLHQTFSFESLDKNKHRRIPFLVLTAHLLALEKMKEELGGKIPQAVILGATSDLSRLDSFIYVLERHLKQSVEDNDKSKLSKALEKEYQYYKEKIVRIGLSSLGESFRLAFATSKFSLIRNLITFAGKIIAPQETSLINESFTVSTLNIKNVSVFCSCFSNTSRFLSGPGLALGVGVNREQQTVTLCLRNHPEISYFNEEALNLLQENYFDNFQKILELLIENS